MDAGEVGMIEHDVGDLGRSPGTKLMTPGGSPAASSSFMM